MTAAGRLTRVARTPWWAMGDSGSDPVGYTQW